MKEINFRIIELSDYQVLIMKDFDNDDDENGDTIVMTAFVDGVKVSNTYGYDSRGKRDMAFDEITEDMAKGFVRAAKNMFK